MQPEFLAVKDDCLALVMVAVVNFGDTNDKIKSRCQDVITFLETVDHVTAASSKAEVVAALGDVDPAKVQAAATVMDRHIGYSKEQAEAYAAVGAISAVVAALAAHAAHVGIQEQLCLVVSKLVDLHSASQVWKGVIFRLLLKVV